MPKKSAKYWLSLIGLVFLVANVGISRILLGVHSFNQVLYGWSYGVWLALVLHTFAREKLCAHVRALMRTRKISQEEYLLKGIKVEEGPEIDKVACFMKAIALWTIIAFLSYANLCYTYATFEYEDIWIERILAKCHPDQTDINSNKIFADSAFIKTGLVSAIFGAYFGLLLDSAFLGGTRITDNETTITKGFGRLVVGGILVLPLILPYLLISSKHSMWFLYLFKCTLSFFVLMILVFTALKPIYKRLELVHRV